MGDSDHILAVKQAAQTRLLGLPGIHAVGIGSKYVAGQPTGELVIIVFVVKKKPLSQLAPYEIVPPEIDGVKTDVIEVEEPTLQATEDDSRYRPLTGGIQIRAGLDINIYGTLGCIARTDEPDPRVVAITCQHVVSMWPGKPTGLTVDVSPDLHTITFGGTATAGSLVKLWLKIMPAGPGPVQDLQLLWITGATDTPEQLASTLVDRITGLANPAVGASRTGARVTITWGEGFIVLVPACFIYDLRLPDPSADLNASTAGDVITLSGRASNDHYGIYTNVNAGGNQPSFGAFTSVARGDVATSVASSIAASLTAQQIPGITATASGPQVTATGAQEIECIVTSDVRVGQQDNTFCSKCCWFCDQQIGHVTDARLDLDIALIQLDPGKEYFAEIEEIGVIKGTHSVTNDDAAPGTYLVHKRGRTTGKTTGTVLAIEVDGDIFLSDASGPPPKRVFHRHYTGALLIKSAVTDPFSAPGDSGSAVVNSSGEVVGILFGGTTAITWATPIDPITSTFNIHVATSQLAGIVRPVPALPAPAGPPHAHALLMAEPGAAGTGAAAGARAPAPDVQRLREMEREIVATPVGARYAALVRRHFAEVHRLVTNNRRVAAVWRRNGGLQLMQYILQIVQRPQTSLPNAIDDRPLAQCLTSIQQILMRYGSPPLAADLRAYGPALGTLAGQSYPQVLAAMQTWAGG